MPLQHEDVTLLATATQVTSNANQVGVLYAHIHNTAGNSAIYIGDSSVTASSYGHTLAAGEEMTIGPFSGGAPLWSDEIYIFGTESDVIHVLLISH